MNNPTNNKTKRKSTDGGAANNLEPAKKARYDPYGDGKRVRRAPRSRLKHSTYEHDRPAATVESLPRNTPELQWAYRVFGPGYSVVSDLDSALFNLCKSRRLSDQQNRQDLQESLGLHGATFYERVQEAYVAYRAEIERVNQVDDDERMRARMRAEKKVKEKERMERAFQTQEVIDLEALTESPSHKTTTIQQAGAGTDGRQQSATSGQASSSIKKLSSDRMSPRGQGPSDTPDSRKIQESLSNHCNSDKPGLDGHKSPDRDKSQNGVDGENLMRNEPVACQLNKGKSDNAKKEQQLIPDEYWMTKDEGDEILSQTGIRIKKMNKLYTQIIAVHQKNPRSLKTEGLQKKLDEAREGIQKISDSTGNTQFVMTMMNVKKNWVWKRQRFNNETTRALIETIRELEKRVSDMLVELRVVAKRVKEWGAQPSNMREGPAQTKFVDDFLVQMTEFVVVSKVKATGYKSFVTMESQLCQAEANKRDGGVEDSSEDGSDGRSGEDSDEGGVDEHEIGD